MKKSSGSKSQILQPEVLIADNLQKTYGNRQALKGLSFSLRAGRVLGFLGPNGAGKTTAIRILTTILEPDRGSFTIDGISHKHPEMIRRRIGVLPESLGFPKQITAVNYLTYFGQLYGFSEVTARANAISLLDEVGLQQRSKSLVGTYSRGMRQRLGIARSLINSPSVVFLDEPTLGLDPRGQQELLALIQRIARERNAGVILCSHLLIEIEDICDDVVIMNLGQMVASGSVAEVIGNVQRNIALQNNLRIQVPSGDVAKAKKVLEGLPSVKSISIIGESDGMLGVELTSVANGNSSDAYMLNNQILGSLIKAKILVINFETKGNNLQDIFLHLTEEIVE